MNRLMRATGSASNPPLTCLTAASTRPWGRRREGAQSLFMYQVKHSALNLQSEKGQMGSAAIGSPGENE